MSEDWRDIPTFPGYHASSLGHIRSANPRYRTGKRSGNLKPWIVNRWGRLSAYVTLYVDGCRTKQLVHRLVALAFHGRPTEEQTDCCHLDHNSLNNHASNLRWDTHSANITENWERRAIMEEELEELALPPAAQDHDTPF